MTDLVPQPSGNKARHQTAQPHDRVVPTDTAGPELFRHVVARQSFADGPEYPLIEPIADEEYGDERHVSSQCEAEVGGQEYGAGHGAYDVSCLRTLFLAGERADPDTIAWAERMLGVPVIDHWWQTETAWAIAGNLVGLGLLPVKRGSPTVPLPGYDLQAVDSAGQPVPTGQMGSLVVKLPLPPGCLPTLWQQDAHMVESYLTEFPGFYKTGDAGYRDADGYVYVMARTDDIINVAGHRLSTGGMEEVLSSHQDVAECAVMGIKDDLKGEVPCGFVVLKAGVNRVPAEVERELVNLVRDKIGPVAAFKIAIVVNRLPKTRSGKILRGTMKKIADGDAWTMPATIDDPAVLSEISGALQERLS
jgi:propionyl-CoA synthetase